MRGVTHFALGICGTSFVGPIVRAAKHGATLPFVAAGMASMLPDLFDFRFARYLNKPELRIVPDPLRPDVGEIAETLATVAGRVARTGQSATVELEPMRLTGEAWQSYTVNFQRDGTIVVRTTDIVDTGGEWMGEGPTASATCDAACAFVPDYTAALRVDRLSGLSFRLERRADGVVIPVFLPWHRRWSHSLVTGLLVSACAGLAFGWMVGAAAAIGYGLHVLVDQLGFLGCALFWPYSGRRYPGRQVMHSGDRHWNGYTNLACCTLTFWNLYRHSDFDTTGFVLPRLLLLGVGVPVLLSLFRRLRRA